MLCADELFRHRGHSTTSLSTGWTCPTACFRIFRGAITALRARNCLSSAKTACHPPKPRDRRAIARTPQVGSHSVLEQGSPRPAEANQCHGETVRSKPMFREAYRRRRCIVPVDGFFEWQATKGGKQLYAIGMKNGAPFGLAGLWENCKDPATSEWVAGRLRLSPCRREAVRAEERPVSAPTSQALRSAASWG